MKIKAATIPTVPSARAPGTMARVTAEIKSDTSNKKLREYLADNGRINTRETTDVAPRTASNAPITKGETPADSPTSGMNATKIPDRKSTRLNSSHVTNS